MANGPDQDEGGQQSSAQGAAMSQTPPSAVEDSEGVQGGPEGPSGDPVVEANPQTGGEPGANPQHEPQEDADEVLQPGKDTDDDPHAHAQGQDRDA